MLRGEPLIPPDHIYPPHEWKFVETRFHYDFLPETETFFSLGNDYLGLRGNFEEGAPSHQNGTFINGFYETWPIVYPEEAYGFARTGQTVVNVTDSKIIKLYVDDEPFFLPTAHLIDFRRELDMQAGTLSREVAYDTKKGIHPQDDTFLTLQKWDFTHTPPDKYPLLLHYHPLVIYRHQVVKQADVVLAMFLLGDEFSLEQKKRNFDFYDSITTGDSSLSVGIQSILAAEVGYIDKAAKYAAFSMLMDISDLGGNVKDGCHIAAMGATWMNLVYGFAGMRDSWASYPFTPMPRKVSNRSNSVCGYGVEYWKSL